ncbi:MAG: heavy metal translocating P-type ATPase, partial [Candidatus Enteromonas sp.]
MGLLWLNEENFPWWVNLLVMSASYLVIAYDIIVNMLKSMIFEHQFFEEETLMVLASLGAFALRFFGPESNEYFEGVLVILLFQIGEFFEDLAEEKSRQSIRSTMDLREQIALVRKGDDFIETPAKNLQIGDIVLLRAGEKCPCDGVISSGIGYFDESSLTGEAMPLEKQVGDP